jgi:hypothetical protein
MDRVIQLQKTMSLSQKTALLCMCYSIVAWLLFPATFAKVAGTYPILRYFFFIPPMVIAGLFVAAFIHSPKLPLSFIWEKLKHRGIGGVLIVAVFIVTATGFTTMKHEYSNVFTFHADPALAALDAAIHFGDAWKLAHWLLPDVLEPVLYTCYSKLWFVQVVGMLVYAAFVADRADRERYFLTVVISVIFLSSVVRIIGSSAGPVLYDRMIEGGRFSDLILQLKSTVSGSKTLGWTDYLYTSYTSQNTVLGTGISAMPSLHVAFAFMNMLFLRSRSVWGGRMATAYFPTILFGSVYFGWHYALDGYVSMFFVYLIWRLVGTLTHPDPSLSRQMGQGLP